MKNRSASVLIFKYIPVKVLHEVCMIMLSVIYWEKYLQNVSYAAFTDDVAILLYCIFEGEDFFDKLFLFWLKGILVCFSC